MIANASKAFPAITLTELGVGANHRRAGLAVAAEILLVGLDQFIEAVSSDGPENVSANAVGQSATAMIAGAFLLISDDSDGLADHLGISVGLIALQSHHTTGIVL